MLASAGMVLFAQGATAGTLVYLTKTAWGCVDPNVTPTINDDTNPGRRDPQWVARTSDEGHCVIITPDSLWESLSPNYNGLTYVAYRGTIGKPGSFWADRGDRLQLTRASCPTTGPVCHNTRITSATRADAPAGSEDYGAGGRARR
jgi:hypothetical protein